MNRRLILLSILLYCIPSVTSAQLYRHDWSNTISLPFSPNFYFSTVSVYDIQDDPSGNVISVGMFTGDIAFDSDQGTVFLSSTDSDDQDIFMKKSDSEGNLLWAKRIGGVDIDKVDDMDIDPQGNIYLTGSFKGNIDFDPSAFQVIAISGQGNFFDGFIAKYNADGEHLWSKPYFFEGNNSSEGIKYDETTNTIYTTGTFRGQANFDSQVSGGILQSIGDRDIYLLNLSPDGDLNWVNRFGSLHDDFPTRLEVDGSGKVYISGMIGSSMEINGQIVGVDNSLEPILVSSEGPDNLSIVNNIESPSNVVIRDMVVSEDVLWVLGTYVGSLTIDGQELPSPTVTSSYDNTFILRRPLNGDPFSIRNISGTKDITGYAITHDGAGQAVVVGSFNGTQDFDWTTSGDQTLQATGNSSGFLLGVSDDGSFTFADKLENTGLARFTAVDYSGANTYLTAGICNDSINLALNTSPSIPYKGWGNQFGFELKIKNKILSAICNEEIVLEVDADGIIAVTVDQVDNGSNTIDGGVMEFSLDVEELDCSNTGEEILVNLTVTDVVFDVTETCQTIIIPIETVPPVAICEDIQVEMDADGIASITTSAIDNGSYDNCAIDSMFISQSDFTCEQVGLNTVSLTVFDQAGNSSSCEAQVSILDGQMPELTCQDLTLMLDEYGEVDLSILENMNMASDNCGLASVYIDLEGEDLCSFTEAGNVVELIALDNSGNTNSCNLTLSIIDEIKPRISCKDISLELEEVDDVIVVEDLELLEFAEDNCGISEIEYMAETLSYNDVGETEFEIMATDINGNVAICYSTIRLLIRVSDEGLVYVPNVFSPNFDGVNDQLAVFSSKKVEQITQFTILDRWGNIHYEVMNEDPDNTGRGWDGKMANEFSPKGVYFYKLRVLAINGEYYEFNGTVNLL